jgi:uncharacterized membrane protein
MHPADHRHDMPNSPERSHPAMRRLTRLLLLPALLLTATGMLLLWPGDNRAPVDTAAGPTRVLGDVLSVVAAPCPPVPEGEDDFPSAADQVCGTVSVKLTSGADAGTEIDVEMPSGPGAIEVEQGDKIVLLLLQDSPEGGLSYSILDFQRSTPLWLLGAAFALAVIAFGRWRGITALAGLAVTFAVLLFFIVPAILEGGSPLMVAIVGAAAIMLTVLPLTHGLNTTTAIAVIGTLLSLTVTAALSAGATAAAHLSGIADETSSYLNITQGDVNMRGLLLAGIVIGSLGVLDDVTVTQSATVTELGQANPSYGFRQLYSAATRIGRAHIASVINTIVLAYAGASLPLMLLFAAGNTPVGELVTGELIAQELVRSAVGTIGLITAVPITTGLASYAAVRSRRTTSEATRHGHDDTATTSPDAPTPRPTDDPWTAFVERNPGWGD